MNEIPFHERAHGADPLNTLIPAITFADGLHIPSLPYMTQIMEGQLYMGGVHPDMALPSNVKYVVSLHPLEYKGTFDRGQLAVQFCGVDDGPYQNPSVLAVAADVASSFMDNRDGAVLIHCMAGVNRSGAATALTLMKRLYWSGDRAINYLRAKRSPGVLYNPAFEKYVRNWEDS